MINIFFVIIDPFTWGKIIYSMFKCFETPIWTELQLRLGLISVQKSSRCFIAFAAIITKNCTENERNYTGSKSSYTEIYREAERNYMEMKMTIRFMFLIRLFFISHY